MNSSRHRNNGRFGRLKAAKSHFAFGRRAFSAREGRLILPLLGKGAKSRSLDIFFFVFFVVQHNKSKTASDLLLT